MTDNLIPTPFDAGWRHGWADATHDGDRYNPPVAFKTEYDQGYSGALTAWDIEHGAEMIPEEDMTEAQRGGLARIRSKRGADWPKAS